MNYESNTIDTESIFFSVKEIERQLSIIKDVIKDAELNKNYGKQIPTLPLGLTVELTEDIFALGAKGDLAEITQALTAHSYRLLLKTGKFAGCTTIRNLNQFKLG